MFFPTKLIRDAKGMICYAADGHKTEEGLDNALGQFCQGSKVVKFLDAYLVLGSGVTRIARKHCLISWIDLKVWQPKEKAGDMIRIFSRQGFDWADIHLMGGSEMARMAVGESDGMTIVGVTVPTDISQEVFNSELKIPGLIVDYVLYLVERGLKIGIKYFVCSGKEAPAIRKCFGKEVKIIVPAIRLDNDPGYHAPDRISTAFEAACYADFLVSGYEIRNGGKNRIVFQTACGLFWRQIAVNPRS